MSDALEAIEALWFGDDDDDAMEAAAARSRAAKVAEKGLRPFPASVARVAQVMQAPDASAGKVEEVLQSDPVLAAKVLSLANGSQYASGRSVDSLRQALVRLGFRTVYDMVVQVALSQAYRGLEGGDQVIEHSADIARAVQLVQLVHPIDESYLYLAGLLHDVGKLLLIQSGEAPDGMGDSDAHAAEERATLGFDHGLLGAVAARTWGLPDPLPEIIASHHDLSRAFAAPGHLGDAVAMVRVAEDLVELASLPDIEEGDLRKIVQATPWEWLRLDHLDAYDLVDMWLDRGQVESASSDWKARIRDARARHQKRIRTTIARAS
jgi:putative nucleotidyltransferase with HDIG domain